MAPNRNKDQSFYTTDSGELDIELPTLRQMPVLCTLEDANSNKIENAVLQQCTDKSIFLSVRLPHKGYYKFIIFAKKEKKYVVAFIYMIHCKNRVGEFMPYPVLFESKVAKYQVVLHEPRVKEIAAKSAVVFRFSLPFLKSVHIEKQVFKKSNDGDNWEFTVDTPGVGTDVTLYGSEEESGRRTALFWFIIK